MNVIIDVTETESFGNCSKSRTAQIEVPSLLSMQDDQEKGQLISEQEAVSKKSTPFDPEYIEMLTKKEEKAVKRRYFISDILSFIPLAIMFFGGLLGLILCIFNIDPIGPVVYSGSIWVGVFSLGGYMLKAFVDELRGSITPDYDAWKNKERK